MLCPLPHFTIFAIYFKTIDIPKFTHNVLFDIKSDGMEAPNSGNGEATCES